jgi:hypothetical protein
LLAVATTISFALLTQLVFVQAGRPQLPTIDAGRPLASFAIFPAIALAALTQLILGLAGAPQLLALATPPASAVANTHTSRTNLQHLRKGRHGKYEEGRRCEGTELVSGHEILPGYAGEPESSRPAPAAPPAVRPNVRPEFTGENCFARPLMTIT